MLRKGQIVQIFEDPITEKKFEDEAKLRIRISKGFNGLERWSVQFLNDGFITERTINAEGKNKED